MQLLWGNELFAVGLEANLSMAAIAEGLVVGMAAAAQPGLGDPVDGAAGATDDFKVADDVQRAVFGRVDLQRAITLRQGFGFLFRRFAAGGEATVDMAVVAEGLVV